MDTKRHDCNFAVALRGRLSEANTGRGSAQKHAMLSGMGDGVGEGWMSAKGGKNREREHTKSNPNWVETETAIMRKVGVSR